MYLSHGTYLLRIHLHSGPRSWSIRSLGQSWFLYRSFPHINLHLAFLRVQIPPFYYLSRIPDTWLRVNQFASLRQFCFLKANPLDTGLLFIYLRFWWNLSHAFSPLWIVLYRCIFQAETRCRFLIFTPIQWDWLSTLPDKIYHQNTKECWTILPH